MPSKLCTSPSVINYDKTDFSETYSIISEIGRGRFAVVRKVELRSTSVEKTDFVIAAAKVLRRRRFGKDTGEMVQREILALELARGHCFSLVQLLAQFCLPQETILLLEHCAGGDLYHLCVERGAQTQVFVRRTINRLLDALKFLHSNELVHLDVKPENLLLRNKLDSDADIDCPDVCLCDFGLTRRLSQGQDVRDLAGTPDYASPEILDYNPIHLKSDMWSTGAVTYFLLTAQSPFMGDSKEATFLRVSKVDVDYSPLRDVLNVEEGQEDIHPAEHFVRSLLRRSPIDRLSAEQAAQHHWLTEKSCKNDIN